MNYITKPKSRWWMFCNYKDTNKSYRKGKQGFTQLNLLTYTLSFIWKTTRKFPDWLSSLSIFDLKWKLYKAVKIKGWWNDEHNCAWNDVMICSCLTKCEFLSIKVGKFNNGRPNISWMLQQLSYKNFKWAWLLNLTLPTQSILLGLDNVIVIFLSKECKIWKDSGEEIFIKCTLK